jgi:hypothetical protein
MTQGSGSQHRYSSNETAQGLPLGAAAKGGQVGLGEDHCGSLPRTGGCWRGNDPSEHGGFSARWQGVRRVGRSPRHDDNQVSHSSSHEPVYLYLYQSLTLSDARADGLLTPQGGILLVKERLDRRSMQA